VGPQDVLDGRGIGTAPRLATPARGELIGDPRGLGALLELADVLLPASPLHRDDRDEASARHEPDEQEPPLEFRHAPEG